MKKFMNKMEMHAKSVIIGVGFMLTALKLQIWSKFQKGRELETLNKCIWYFEKGHYVLSNYYGECVEKGVLCNKGILDLIDQYNELLWEMKQTRAEIQDLMYLGTVEEGL